MNRSRTTSLPTSLGTPATLMTSTDSATTAVVAPACTAGTESSRTPGSQTCPSKGLNSTTPGMDGPGSVMSTAMMTVCDAPIPIPLPLPHRDLSTLKPRELPPIANLVKWPPSVAKREGSRKAPAVPSAPVPEASAGCAASNLSPRSMSASSAPTQASSVEPVFSTSRNVFPPLPTCTMIPVPVNIVAPSGVGNDKPTKSSWEGFPPVPISTGLPVSPSLAGRDKPTVPSGRNDKPTEGTAWEVFFPPPTSTRVPIQSPSVGPGKPTAGAPQVSCSPCPVPTIVPPSPASSPAPCPVPIIVPPRPTSSPVPSPASPIIMHCNVSPSPSPDPSIPGRGTLSTISERTESTPARRRGRRRSPDRESSRSRSPLRHSRWQLLRTQSRSRSHSSSSDDADRNPPPQRPYPYTASVYPVYPPKPWHYTSNTGGSLGNHYGGTPTIPQAGISAPYTPLTYTPQQPIPPSAPAPSFSGPYPANQTLNYNSTPWGAPAPVLYPSASNVPAPPVWPAATGMRTSFGQAINNGVPGLSDWSQTASPVPPQQPMMNTVYSPSFTQPPSFGYAGIRPQTPLIFPSQPFTTQYVTQDAAKPPTRNHERFYLEDGNLLIQVKDVVYKVHRHFFSQELSAGDAKALAEANTETEPAELDDIEPQDFDMLLSLFYPKNYARFDAQTADDWAGILRVSYSLSMKKTRALAFEKLDEITSNSPADRIKLAQEFGIDHWLVPAYKDLCMRSEPVSEEEGEKIGVSGLVKIAKMKHEMTENLKSYMDLDKVDKMIREMATEKLKPSKVQGLKRE